MTDPMCECGHSAHWHAADLGRRNGWGSCEHDAACVCHAFVPAAEDWAQGYGIVAPTGDWYFVSFASDDEYLGGVYVHCSTVQAALMRTHLLDINPGGVASFVGPILHETVMEIVPEGDRERLLNVDEILAHDDPAD